MTSAATGSPWAGRALALVGVLLVSINLRTAVAALSPIFSDVAVDIPLGSLGIGLLGTLPPLCFAVFGLLTPVFQRRLGLEALTVVALTAMVLGDLGRAVSPSYAPLALFSVLTFAGMGMGNVLLPPLVKKYFPSRVGLVTSLYATSMALFALLPPLVAVPVSDTAGWRVSVGAWAVFAAAALVPWVTLLLRDRRLAGHPDATGHPGAPATTGATATTVSRGADELGRAWHSPLAWALALMFGATALNVYAMFAWLPEIVADTAGVTPAQGGALLALYSAMGIPFALVIPVIAARLRSITVLVWLGTALYVIGYLGLLLAPATLTWLWVGLAGSGPLLFPLSLVLVNLRTRTQRGSVALSGFMQGLGYLIGAAGPLVVGVLHQFSGQWMPALLFLLATTPVILIAGLVVSRPKMLEDSWPETRRTLDR